MKTETQSLNVSSTTTVCYQRNTKQLLSLFLKKKRNGIHFIISFQYFINSIVITVKAGFFDNL